MNNQASMIAKGFSKPTARVERLKQAVYDATPVLEVERLILVTKAYQESANLSPVMRRAKMMEKLLNNMHITIRDDELIVGSVTEHPRSSEIHCELSLEWLVDELDTISTRPTDPYYVSEESKKIIRSLAPYWEGKTNSEYALSLMSHECIAAMEHGVYDPGSYLYGGIGHSQVDYGRILERGFEGVIEDCEAELAKLDRSDPECIKKEQFYKALMITYTAAINFAHRYARKAEEMAEEETNPVRKAELLQIAKNCQHVPQYGARNFYEAIQAFWFVHCIIRIENNGYSYSPGPFDRYMYPFYKNDSEISEEFVQELLDCLYVKFNDSATCRDKITAQAFAGYGMFEQVALSGMDEKGNDLTNDVSYLCLNAAAHVQMPQPSNGVRISNQTPDEFLYRVCEVVRLGFGQPAIFNDEVIIEAMMNRGIPLEVARTYSPSGCVEPTIAHFYDGWHSPAFFNLAKVLEITLNNGMDKGEQIGPKTGDVTTFTSMDDFTRAFETQLQYFVRQLVDNLNCIDIAFKEKTQNTFQSALISDCIAKGKTVQEGGARYSWTGPQGIAVADAADALYAIEKNVFIDKKLTMSEIKDAMDHNFGFEVSTPEKANASAKAACMNVKTTSPETNMEQKIYEVVKEIFSKSGSLDLSEIQNKAAAMDTDYSAIYRILDNTPCYGNDIDEVDKYAVLVARLYCEELVKYKNARGGIFQAALFPVSGNVIYGYDVGALPSGRLAGTPLADGVSPRPGKDINGPTAAANSVSKLDHALASNGTLYNQKYLPSALEGDSGLMNLAAVIRGYFERKGMEMQFNVIDRETLIRAQQNPEQYKNLVVRVAGYSANFTKLAKDMQDNIIARTEQRF